MVPEVFHKVIPLNKPIFKEPPFHLLEKQVNEILISILTQKEISSLGKLGPKTWSSIHFVLKLTEKKEEKNCSLDRVQLEIALHV